MDATESADLWLGNYFFSLNSSDKNIRSRCLEELQSKIIQKDVPKDLNKSRLISLVAKCFSDATEICREKSISLVTLLLETGDTDDEFVSVIIPQIYSKMGIPNDLETCEEVRILHLELLNLIINKYNSYITTQLETIVKILANSITDSCPEVKRLGCACASNLAKGVPDNTPAFSELLIEVIIKNMKNSNYKMKISAIQSLQYLVQNGTRNSVQLVCPPLEEAMNDSNINVRKAVLEVVTYWLMKLPGRYSAFDKLIPLALLSLCEEVDEIRKQGEEAWLKIGEQYLLENEDTYKNMIDYEPEVVPYYPKDVVRPSLGCRLLVRKEMGRIITYLISGLKDWMDTTRLKSSKSLVMVALHAESYIIQYLDKMMPMFFRIFRDDNPALSKYIIKTVEVMGYFVPVHVYCTLLLPEIKEFGEVGHYKIFSAFISTSPKKDVLQHLGTISATLSSHSVCGTYNTVCQDTLLTIVSNILRCIEEADNSVSLDEDILYSLYTIVLTVSGYGDQQNRSKIDGLEKRLYKCGNFKSLGEMNRKFFEPLLARLIESSTIWSQHSVDFHTFLSLFRNHFCDLVNYNFDQFIQLLSFALSVSSIKETVHKILLEFIEISRQPEIMNNVEDVNSLIESVITGPLNGQLVWRPGKIAEMLRCTSVILIGNLVKCVNIISESTAEMILPLVVGCCEDSLELIRISSLKCIADIVNLCRMNVDYDVTPLMKHVPIVLGRLEDKNKDVRALTVPALRSFLTPDVPTTYKSPRNELTLHLYYTLLTHLKDEENVEFHSDLLDLLKEISYIQPRILLENIQPSDCNNWEMVRDLATYLKDKYHIG